MSQLLLDVLGDLNSTEKDGIHDTLYIDIPNGSGQVADEISIGH